MAKITVEDCLQVIPNHFELTIMASNRARELIRGATAIISVNIGEKSTVTALREIASGKFSAAKMKQLRYAKR